MQKAVGRETKFAKALWFGLMGICLLLFLALLLIWGMQKSGASTEAIQIDEYPEWLKEMDIQFAEGVEILGGDWNATMPNPSVESFGDVTVDYLNLKLTLADGRLIDLPQEVTYYTMPEAIRIENRLLWFSHNSEGIGFEIDLETGAIREYAISESVSTPCGNFSDYLMDWMLVDVNGQGYFCELATGERVGPIVYAEPESEVDTIPGLSPDGRIVAIRIYGQEDSILFFDTQSREWTIVEGVLLALPGQQGQNLEWIGSDYMLSSFFVGEGDGVMTVIELETFELVKEIGSLRDDHPLGLNSRPIWQDDEQRVQTIYWNYPPVEYIGVASPAEHCYVEYFYPYRNETEILDYGPFCYLKAGEWGGLGYFLVSADLLPENIRYRREAFRNEVTAIVRYDAITGESEVIYAGAIEDIVQISPDENHALLRLSKENEVSRAFAIAYDAPNYTARLVLMDLRDETILYEEETRWREYPFMDWDSGDIMDISLSNHGWSFSESLWQDFHFYRIDEANQLNPVESPYIDMIRNLGGDWFAIMTGTGDGRFDLRLVNAGTQDEITLLSYSSSFSYLTHGSYIEENRFELRFSTLRESVPYQQSYSFSLRVRN